MKEVLLPILLLLGLAACVYSETCPSPENLHLCYCEEDEDTENIVVTCYGNPSSLEDLKKILNSLSGKKDVEIELDELDLGKVPSDFFSGIGVERLAITHCELDSLTDDDSKPALSGLEDTLEELDIISSFTEDNVPSKLKIGHLRRLKALDLSYNVITELGNDWFEGESSSLEYITISNNGITKIGDKVFEDLSNLVYLSLDGNRFGGVQRSMFPNSAEALTSIELDNNDLGSIPEDIFTAMPSLEDVSLRNNGITKLEESTWKEVWEQLHIIYLEGNPLKCDSHMNWMFDLRVTRDLYGSCETPEDKHGKDLFEFIDTRGE